MNQNPIILLTMMGKNPYNNIEFILQAMKPGKARLTMLCCSILCIKVIICNQSYLIVFQLVDMNQLEIEFLNNKCKQVYLQGFKWNKVT